MNIVFRTDASLQIGTGHVMRCLTLANILKGMGAQCHFITRKNAGPLPDRIKEQGHAVHILADSKPDLSDKTLPQHIAWLEGDWRQDAGETKSIAAGVKADWLIVDHYALDARWEEMAKPANTQLMTIDDLADRKHICTLLLDQNLGRRAEDYGNLIPDDCRRFLGPRFALVRPEFFAKREQVKNTSFAERFGRNWLACVGGIDLHDILGKILSAWEILPDPKPALTLAVGETSPNIDALKRRIASLRNAELHVQSTHMADLMARAGLFIGTTGSISWERCCLGLPSVMGMVAENQCANLEALVQAGTGISVGDWREISTEALAAQFKTALQQAELYADMTARAAKLVDGKGAERVALVLNQDKLILRKATPDDAKLVYPWRNDAETRRYFFNSESIPLPSHIEWWEQSLNSSGRDLLIAEIEKKPIGVTRFDCAGGTATVSIYLAPDYVGTGLGAAMLNSGIDWCREQRPEIGRVVAKILPENKASLSAFRKAGFKPQQDQWVAEIKT